MKVKDSIKMTRKKFADACKSFKDAEVDITEKGEKSVAGDIIASKIVEKKDEMDQTYNYKPLRDMFVKILQESSQPKAKEYLNEVLYKYDPMFNRDTRTNGANDFHCWKKLMLFITNIVLAAKGLKSPNAKKPKEVDDSCAKDTCAKDEKKIITFDPNEYDFPIKRGQKVKAAQDIAYGPVEDMVDMIDITKEELVKNGWKIDEKEDLVYIPEGTEMKFLGAERGSGWPTFELLGDEFDFSGDSFELELYEKVVDAEKEIKLDGDELEKAIQSLNGAEDVEYVADAYDENDEDVLVFAAYDRKPIEIAQKFLKERYDNVTDIEYDDATESFLVSIKTIQSKDKVGDVKIEDESKGAQIAKIIAEALAGECGPHGGEDPKLQGNRLGLWSQMPTEWYRFNDDGSVDFENLEQLLKNKQYAEEFGVYDEEDRQAVIADIGHFNNVTDLLHSDLSWFMYLDNEDEILKRVNEMLKNNVEDSKTKDMNSVDEAQKWVDYDMKKYGHISEETNEALKKAGFKVVKDEYGDYEVIAGETHDSSCKDEKYPDAYEGKRAIFYPEGFEDMEHDDPKEYKKIMKHKGEECTITGCAIDDYGDFEYDYWDIKFDDGYEIDGVQGVSLTLKEEVELEEDLEDKIREVLDDYGILYGDVVNNDTQINLVGIMEDEWEEARDAIKAELGLEVLVPDADHEEYDDELIVEVQK